MKSPESFKPLWWKELAHDSTLHERIIRVGKIISHQTDHWVDEQTLKMKQKIIRVITGPLQTAYMNQNPQPVNQIKVGNKTQQDKLKVPKLDNKIQLTKPDG